MGKIEFDKLLEKYSKDEHEFKFDPEKEKNEWLGSILKLYSEIETWLKEYIDNQRISISYINVSLCEDLFGTYNAKKMIIIFANQKVTLNPVGRFIIGAKGRVDFEGKRKSVQLLLVDENLKFPGIKINMTINGEDFNDDEEIDASANKDINYIWKLSTPPPNIEFITLDEKLFFDILTDLISA